MEITKATAIRTLKELFKHINKFNKNSEFISVTVDNCTIYFPVNNLDEAKIPEFRERFKTIYNIAKGQV